MAENSKIEWTDHTFNPWIGCTKVSDGCKNCYAEMLMDKRYGRVEWGPQGTRQRTSAANWRKPLAWNRKAAADGRRYRVFCASLADVFEDRPELIHWRVDLLNLIMKASHLDWLLLTKRPENVNDMVPAWWRNVGRWPAHVWIGTSVENQAAADERILHLLRIPARVRFLSCEPLLGPVDLRTVGPEKWDVLAGWKAKADNERGWANTSCIDWVICGGESGHYARPMHPDWARSLRDQCQAAGVAFHFKQWGEWGEPGQFDSSGYDDTLMNEHGCTIWPDGHMEFGWHGTVMDGSEVMWGVGKHTAGRLLDGREWDEYPQLEVQDA